jgi:uncharacterized phage infection (PIP) family protein YhgE
MIYLKKLLKIKMVWTPVWTVALLMLAMVSIYLPVFKGADQKLTDFPLIIVNEDKDFSQQIDGKKIFANLPQVQDGHSLKWATESSEEKARQAIKENKANGALIIPVNYSSQITKIHDALLYGEKVPKPIEVKVLINEGGGQMATSVAPAVLQSMVSSASANFSGELKQELIKANKQVSPQATSLLDQPITPTTSNVLGLPGDLNKGMTPFILVIIASITGFMGTQMVHGYVNKISEKMRERGLALSNTTVLLTDMLLGVILMVVTSSALMVVVFGFFNSNHSINVWPIWLFVVLCTLTMYFMFKMLSLTFGKWGILVMFPINIMGIFGSGGAIPLTGLPDFHRYLATVLPTRYMEDGLRSLVYFEGNMEAGLGTALWVLFGCLVVFMGICLSITSRTYKKDKITTKETSPLEMQDSEAETEEQSNQIVLASAPVSEEIVKTPSKQSVKATMITLSKDQDNTNDEWYRKALLNFTIEENNASPQNGMKDDIFRQALIMINKQN